MWKAGGGLWPDGRFFFGFVFLRELRRGTTHQVGAKPNAQLQKTQQDKRKQKAR